VIIDFHVHTFPGSVQRDRGPYLEQDAAFRSLYNNPRAQIATADDLLRSMDTAGVDLSVMQGFAWSDAGLCRRHNDDLLDAAARHPSRLIAFCTLQPAGEEEAATEALRCLDAATPARGFGELRPDYQGYSGRWAALGPMWQAVRPHGAPPLLVHASEPVGHRYPGKGAMTPEVLIGLADAYPEWPMVLAHLGGGLPFYAAMPEVQNSLHNIWIDTAAWPLLYGPEVFTALAATFGTDRILFGSDYPLQAQDRSVARLRGVPLTSEELSGVLGGNAARLLGLGGG
jgi:hypothetical protein